MNESHAPSFIVAGASGNLGRQLVPLLSASGARMLLVGRDKNKLREIFPHHEVAIYADIPWAAGQYEDLIFLATTNSDSDASYEQFERTNVALALEARNLAAAGGVKRFTYFSSVHALEHANQSHYARSKRAAEEALNNSPGIVTKIIYIPALLGKTYSGSLAVLNRTPTFLAKLLLPTLKALKPTVNVTAVSKELLTNSAFQSNQSVILATDQDTNLAYTFLKRCMDLLGAAAIVLLLWWLMIIVWIVIKVQSPGPGIFRQRRIGLNGKEFTCYKFRTMHLSAPNVATHEAPSSAVTPFGKILRRTKIDELPQVFNIFVNEMSFVGPRPCLPTQTELIEERRKRAVLTLKPGITGLAQVNDIDMSDPVRLAVCDERYLKLRSIIFDLKLMLMTVAGKGMNDKIGKAAK
ncbi:sugar transferase [Devosia sp. BK]|uniref:sugar transferase n=1 Tax=Devosia sp. BK TaxID=2871706 RepID=UPI002939BBC4|nr:sugar transferase [Devosia sp. BK]MDV3253800.1 sugar transferase [Devosia sp. BK]